MALITRRATLSDLPRLVELNHAAYPDLVVEGVVFDAAQIAAHLATFPEGQLVVEEDGGVIGAMATLVVPSAVALASHTWSGVTGEGLFQTHEPNADVLYLADVYVDPGAWGRGVSKVLYAALFDLCRALGKRRVVAGGRLWGYHEVARSMSPATYVDEVVRGVRRDRVLGSQLRAGFVVDGILPGYLHDWRSGHFATLLTWQNPELRDDPSPTRCVSVTRSTSDQVITRA
jgi:GNAT superfamily N-acetyltransferase